MQEPTDIRVFIADDHSETVLKMSEFINAAEGMQVVGTAVDGNALWQYFSADHHAVDIALVDIGMPGMDGITAVGKIKRNMETPVKVIVITGLHGRNYPAEAISHHADGFIAKSRHKDEIIEAINRVHKGELVYLPDLDDPSQPTVMPERPPELTPVESRILCLVLEGQTSKEIAEEVTLSMPHVDKIRLNLMHKLGAKNAAQLGAVAEKYGLCR
jgi:DNA-binding NarL/FixJ family response regulator